VEIFTDLFNIWQNFTEKSISNALLDKLYLEETQCKTWQILEWKFDRFLHQIKFDRFLHHIKCFYKEIRERFVTFK